MTRVAVVASFNRPCGIGDVAARLARALPSDCSPTLVELPEEDRPNEWRRVIRRVRGHDVVHIHYEYSLFHAVKPLRNRFGRLLGRIGTPVVVTLHDTLPGLEPRWPHWRTIGDGIRDLGYLPFFRWWGPAQYRRADRWIAHSRPVYEKAEVLVDPGTVSLLPLPVPPASRSWRWSPSDQLTIVSPGFVKPHKGYELLVEVLERLPGWNWVVAGGSQDDRDRRFVIELKRRVADAGLSQRVRFTGYCPEADVESELARATMAVLPFHRAAASSSLGWAVACETPVVAADLPAFAEVAEDGAGVDLIAGRDADRWADRLAELAGDHDRLGRLATASRRYSADRSDAAVAAAHAEIFRELAKDAVL